MSRKIGIPRDEILNDFMDIYRATNVFWKEKNLSLTLLEKFQTATILSHYELSV